MQLTRKHLTNIGGGILFAVALIGFYAVIFEQVI